jgi:uncharacterized protein involved in copper resistance
MVIAADVVLTLMLACALTATAAVADTAAAAALQRHAGTPSPTATGDMTGMAGMSGMSDDMPGMDHGNGSEMPGMSNDMPGMDHGTGGPAPDRPLGLVLGGFGAGSAAVMASAAFVRRRDLATSKTRQGRSRARKDRS